ncbi:MAG TPA: ABC transporter permease [Terriglobia bacterium]|nr:ABC transporter permease [Terriglobia bacterium]
MLEFLLKDFRYGCRTLLRNRGFTLVVVLTLALGIGANTAVFSVVNGVLLRPAPVADINGLAMVWETDRRTGTIREPASVPDYLDFAARSRSFQSMAAVMAQEVNLKPAGSDPIRLAALRVTSRFLPMLGMMPVAGRHFTDAEDRIGSTNVVMIGESLWEHSFNRDRAVIGQTIRLDEIPYTVVGVVPRAADFGAVQILSAAAYSRGFVDRDASTRVDIWLPLRADPQSLPRSTHPIFVIARLANGVTGSAAQEEMTSISADLERNYRENEARGVFVEPVARVVFGPVQPALYVLLGAVALVLLVACVNVANLWLARGAGRGREVLVRSALGAGFGQLARQFLVESITLTLFASGVGLLVAFAGLRLLIAAGPADIPRLAEVTIDLRVLATTGGVTLLIGVLFGMLPTLQARRVRLQAGFQTEGDARGTMSRSRNRLRGILVVAEISMAVLLMIGAGLLIRSFWQLQQVDSGFQASGVLKAEYQLPATRYPADFRVWPNFKEMHAFTNQLLLRAATLAGVESVAVTGSHPIDPGFTNSFIVVGREAEARNWPEISVRQVTPGYFQTVNLGLVRGRLIEDSDGTLSAPVALLNEAAARRFFPSQDPIGAQIRFWGQTRRIVGIVANEKFHGLAEASPIATYLPMAQAPSAGGAGVLLIRTNGDPATYAAQAREIIKELDPGLAVFGVESLERTVSRSVSRPRFTMLLLGVFAAVALLLAAVGVYGVLSCGVVQRTREMGIRMALGANPRQLMRLILNDACLLVFLGVALGLTGAFVLTRRLTTLLFGVSPTDPATFLGVAAVLGAVGLIAGYVPARRATRVHPAISLRAE